METVPRSKKRKSNRNKEFIVSNREAGTISTAKSVTVEPIATHLEAAASGSALTAVTNEERHQLIAEAAYFRAERRNFTPGYELEDWLDAEAEVEMKLSQIGTQNPLRNA